jgi:hypothetical protein
MDLISTVASLQPKVSIDLEYESELFSEIEQEIPKRADSNIDL